MSGEPRHLFVYGTLRRESSNRYARMLKSRARFIGEAFARGALFRIGSFPGAVFDDACPGKVFGDVFQLDNATILSELDIYEECDGSGKGGLFRRDVIQIEQRCIVRRAWAYAYIGSVAALPFIPSGRFVP